MVTVCRIKLTFPNSVSSINLLTEMLNFVTSESEIYTINLLFPGLLYLVTSNRLCTDSNHVICLVGLFALSYFLQSILFFYFIVLSGRTIQECDDSETFVDFSKEKPDVLFFVLNEVIPDVYKQGQITLLALLTRCQQPLLRDRALRYIQLLLLLNRDQTLYSVDDIKKTEIILFGLFSKAAMSQQDDALVSILVTYLITLVIYIMSCHSQGNDAECDGHLDVITGRNTFQDVRFKYNKKKPGVKNTSKLVKKLLKCVLSWQRQKCKELNSKITTSEEEEELATEDMKLFLLVSSIIQVIA